MKSFFTELTVKTFEGGPLVISFLKVSNILFEPVSTCLLLRGALRIHIRAPVYAWGLMLEKVCSMKGDERATRAENLLTNGLQMMLTNTDFGRPMKPFFIEIPKHLDLGRQFGQIHFGAFGVFSDNLSATILVQ